MQLGMIGLGRMGANMVRRLSRAGHGNADFVGKGLFALRFEFGGHPEKPAEDGPKGS